MLTYVSYKMNITQVLFSGGGMKESAVIIKNKTGLHTRPAKGLIDIAKEYSSEIIILKGGQEYATTSLIKIMQAGICQYDEIIIRACGDDEDEAVQGVLDYISTMDPES